MGTFDVSEDALADMDEIRSYVARDSQFHAGRLIERFYEKFGMLAQHPDMGRERKEFPSWYRSFPSGNYSIFYRPTEHGIKIFRVVHQARDVGRVLTSESGDEE